MTNNLLEIRDLTVSFECREDKRIVLDAIKLDISPNEIVVLAGESGSGKTMTALSITKILPQNAKIISGAINFSGSDLLMLGDDMLAKIRGKEIAYIFQEPTSFLNPVYSIGNQIIETIMLHQQKNRYEAAKETLLLLESVRIADPQRVFYSYPHQLSGGMNQRVFLAMAIASKPKLIIADEPTTALDVTIEAQILDLLRQLKKKLGFSLLFITHNLSIAKKIADRIYIMHRGNIVEEATTRDLFSSPKHFHTKELIHAYEKIGRI